MLVAAPLWTLVLGGDVMLNAVAPSDAIWKGIAPTVRAADLALANLEIPLTDSREPTPFKTAEELKRRDQFILKASPAHAPFLARAGWDIVAQANNHAMDYGSNGLRQMQSLLRKHGIGYTGAGANSDVARRPAVFRSRQGFRVAVISGMAFVSWTALRKVGPASATSYGVNGLSFNGVIEDDAKADLTEWISEAKRVSDFVVVAFHWGTERKTLPNLYQVQLGRAAIDCGADIVWGHHPHVLQGAEIYREKPIFYSAGNLVSPLPGETALFRLAYDGDTMKALEVLPAWIAGGKVGFYEGRTRQAALTRFRGLCADLVRKYPNKNSVAALR
ncbi:MAG: CapA family protein [Fimbriimonas sp.]